MIKPVLHLGCGENRIQDAVNVDAVLTDATDVVFDLSQTPWPQEWAPDDSFERVEAVDIIEHFVHVVPIIGEIHRVLKIGGKAHIRTTSWKSENAFTGIDHHHYFTLKTFDCYDKRTVFGKRYPQYRRGGVAFRIVSAREDGQELEFVLEKEQP